MFFLPCMMPRLLHGTGNIKFCTSFPYDLYCCATDHNPIVWYNSIFSHKLKLGYKDVIFTVWRLTHFQYDAHCVRLCIEMTLLWLQQTYHCNSLGMLHWLFCHHSGLLLWRCTLLPWTIHPRLYGYCCWPCYYIYRSCPNPCSLC